MTHEDVALGMTAGWFTVERGPFSKNGRKWACVCRCGTSLDLNISQIRKKIENDGSCQKCRFKRGVRHGKSKLPSWSIWQAMKQRCYNPNHKSYPDYGGRGIKVCDRWLNSFEAFYEDMGPRPSSGHSIERRDVHGDYGPNNCFWATKVQQALNTRHNIRVLIDGEEAVGLKEISRRLGVSLGVATGCWNRGTITSRFPQVTIP